jgi:hypothetical protein
VVSRTAVIGSSSILAVIAPIPIAGLPGSLLIEALACTTLS